MKSSNRFVTPTYTLFRLMAGLLFTCHGAQKLFGMAGATRMTAPLMVTAGVIELFGGLLIAAGLFASFAAFLASGEMAVAYFTRHAPHAFLPIVNHGELAVLYCFAFLFIAASGSGAWSLDALIWRREAA